MSESNQTTAAWVAGGIVAAAAAFTAIPKLVRALVNTARMAVSVNDAMPVVVQLPKLILDQNRVAADQGKMLAEIKGGVTVHLDKQDKSLAEIKNSIERAGKFTTTLKYHLSESMIRGVAKHAEGHAREILFVDDESQTLKAMKLLFGSSYTVITANSAREAEEMIGDGVHVIICDQRMPRESGAELLTKLHDRYPFAVRILLSAYLDLGAIVDAVNKGRIQYFLEKPVEPERLRAVIAECVAVSVLMRTFEERAKNA
jgi:CheY-like chemotaxis protein